MGEAGGAEVARVQVGRMTKRDRQIILSAACIIAQHAVALHDCHTFRGKWPKGEASVRREYLHMLDVAAGLCRIHNRRERKA